MTYERKMKPRPAVIVIPEHDWPKLINECRRAGYSNTSIEAAVGLSKERIYSLIEGKNEILWKHGEALLKFVELIRKGEVTHV